MARLASGLVSLLAGIVLTAGLAWAQAEVQPPAEAVQVEPEQAMPSPGAPVITSVVWIEQPDGRDYALLFPPRALRERVDGLVSMDCLVDGEGRLDCTVVVEDPEGYGFGAATLEIAREFRLAPETRDGQPTAGGRVRRTIRWMMANSRGGMR
jgi:protein TonB